MADTATPAGAESKSNGLSIALIMLVAMLAAGGGVYVLFANNVIQRVDPETAENAAFTKRKEATQYVKLDPPFVVNFEAKGLMRFLQVAIEVMTRDMQTADLIKKHDPMIRNELILLFGNQKYETIVSREGKEALRAEALQAVAKVISDEGGDGQKVEQLFFTSFVMQ